MESNKKINELSKVLPRGSYLEISKRAKVSPKTVTNVMEGKKCNLFTTMNVVREAEKLLAEYNEIMGIETLKPATDEKV